MSISFRTHFQPDITIVEVRGAVDAGSGSPLIVDLSGVDFFGGDGFRALVRIAQEFRRPAQRWALVTGEAVDRMLEVAESDHRLPTNASLEDALRQLTFPDQGWLVPYRVTPPEVTRC